MTTETKKGVQLEKTGAKARKPKNYWNAEKINPNELPARTKLRTSRHAIKHSWLQYKSRQPLDT